MELLDEIEFFDCMDTCPDVFSLLDESDIDFINYSNDELFTELTMSEDSVCVFVSRFFILFFYYYYYCYYYYWFSRNNNKVNTKGWAYRSNTYAHKNRIKNHEVKTT